MKYSWLSNVKKNEFQSQKIKTWVAYSQAESSEEHGERCIHSTYIYWALSLCQVINVKLFQKAEEFSCEIVFI